ncbi:spore cortex-lytic enzyme [Bacillus sp. JCM 19046]|uniref:N-acetylmuramoyl-L-alanine amidase n=1 Tax=Shouchella xiaoxiensis TaxID=766895 RepID=A0ABS2SY07_9BACI|nr:cell wall hydrolase [Shouchella xiaoxiensis]MBM7840388.1 N-acetylmuramoyl-L-alanine amidase [Shouchella xiaoxiensis]GAF13587.1 spore cortex-lytic enzyme [Bacillus sp. JCM 19045]GAF19425.1 spore cortex-lytic enzyme [Bacillus sp. JCM 19046]
MILKSLFLFSVFIGISMFSQNSAESKALKHPVQQNDSLFTLSERYGVSADSIKRMNNINSNVIEVGQTLTIPAAVTSEERELLAQLVHAEAKGESYAGKVAVATVVLNRVDHADYPDTVSEVIYQVTPSGHYAFSPVLDGAIHTVPDGEARKAVNEAISARGQGQQSLYFYNPATATSGWVATREQTIVIGNHVFAK